MNSILLAIANAKQARIASAGFAMLLVAVVSGCSDEPFDYIRAKGRITYEDGAPIPTEGGLRLTFYSEAPPVDGKYFPRPGSAMPDANGDFETMTMRPGDGLVPGRHQVTVSYMSRSTKDVLPTEYTLKGKTPLVIDTAELPLEIKIPRP